MAAPHDHPTSQELIEAVHEWLERDVLPAVEGRLQFHARVAMNILEMVNRELTVGAQQEQEHRQRLARLGYESDADLAHAIREGRHDHELATLLAELRGAVRDKVMVANPKYVR